MKKSGSIGVLLLMTSQVAISSDDMADQYFSNKRVIPTPQEKVALGIGKRWQKGNYNSKPFPASDGSISFIFGSGQIQIMCAVLQICDIALQPGEVMSGKPHVGDPRFNIEQTVTGSGATQQQHLIIKPMDVGLDTSVVVPTDRRVYHFRLRSSRHDFMPYVSFTYPEVAEAARAYEQQQQYAERERNTLPATGEYLKNLNFNYTVAGDATWKPTRVFNDGVKTVIEMPANVSQNDAPALLVLKQEGGLLSDDQTAIVNYRLQDNRYIVDSVFDKAILVVGVGDSQDKITITKESQ